MAADTVDRMRVECESFAAAQKTPDRMLAQRARRLAFVHSMLRGLSARAVTNEKRLANEQSLVCSALSFPSPHSRTLQNHRANEFYDIAVESDRSGQQ